jgi:hypothetical protein
MDQAPRGLRRAFPFRVFAHLRNSRITLFGSSASMRRTKVTNESNGRNGKIRLESASAKQQTVGEHAYSSGFLLLLALTELRGFLTDMTDVSLFRLFIPNETRKIVNTGPLFAD